MKINFLLKSFPFLSIFLLLVFININNQNINTKLKILIWNTPSFSLGSYLAISAGAGFIFSYITTTHFASIIKHNSNKSIKYKTEFKNTDTNENDFTNLKKNNDKTLIERNIYDPSPTIEAQFRVIGKAERYNKDNIDNNIQYDSSYDYEESYIDQNKNNKTINNVVEDSNDWNDESFTNW